MAKWRICVNLQVYAVQVAEGGEEMFGLSDPWIWGAYLLCLLSTMICIAYGFINWNRGAEEEKLQIVEEAALEKANQSKL